MIELDVGSLGVNDLSVDNVLALEPSEYVRYTRECVEFFQEKFKQEPSVKMQISLIEEEGLELADAGLSMFDNVSVKTVAHYLKEFADFSFVMAGILNLEMQFVSYELQNPQQTRRIEFAIRAVSQAVEAAVMELGWDTETFNEAARVAFYRVFQSNLTKLGADGEPIYSDLGKILKGPNYQEPFLDDLAEKLIASSGQAQTLAA